MPNPYLEGNFAPVLVERSDDRPLPVTGVVPPDLDGRFLRNGPNPAVAPISDDPYRWFDGDGMVHDISLVDGQATGYRNRWVRTRRVALRLGTSPPHGPLEPVDGPANTHVIRHGGLTLALGETGLPHALSDGLDRARVHDFDGDLASPMCPHPKVDPENGELCFFGMDVFGPPFLRFHVADRGGRLMRTEEIDLPEPVLMHDFGVTASRVVFLDLPVAFDPDRARATDPVPFRWVPEAGGRFGIMSRAGGEVQWLPVDACFVFHVVNAFDDGDAVVVDAVRYERAFERRADAPLCTTVPGLVRWRLEPATGRVEALELDDTPVEFPRIDDRVTGRPHRFVYASTVEGTSGTPDFPALVQYDLARDRSVRFEPGAGKSVAEPVFVRAGDGRGEDEGWVLVPVYDAARQASDLVILDGTSFAGPPVAVVHLPARIPFGFHGSWVPTGT